MPRSDYGWANHGRSPVLRGEDDLRDRIAPDITNHQGWRYCEALILLPSGKYTGCGKNPVESHHRLTRARGGRVLDEAGELYHLMDLCPQHHRMADGGDARAGGLVIDGYVTSCTQCGRPSYSGPDQYLQARYGPEVHVQCVSSVEARDDTGQGLRGEARA